MADRRKLVPTDSKSLVVNKALERGINQINRIYVNYLTTRLAMARKLDQEPNRDIDKETGVPENPDPELYWQVFCKEGIANRAVRCMPDESWALYPEVYEDENPKVLTGFETDWNELVRKKNVFHYLHRADVASRVGTRGGLFIGLDDGRDPKYPVMGFSGKVDADGNWLRAAGAQPKQRKITFLMPFPEHLIGVRKLNDDRTSPLYMSPEIYQVKVSGTEPDIPTTSEVRVKADTIDVHWTRILPLADNRIASDVTGHSTLEPILNRVYGLRKTLGSAPEMFYKGAFPGISFETHPDISDEADLDKESIKKEIEEYAAGLKRYMRLIGMTARSLAPQVADPTNHFATLIQSICATLGIPMRIFLGSEAGHLASTQDRSNWLQRVGHRQTTYLEPMVLRPFVDRCITLGVVRKPKDGYKIDWKDLYSLSWKEKADVAVKKAQALLQYVTSGAEQIMPISYFLTLVLQLSPAEAEAVIAAAKENKDKLTEKVWNQPPKQLAAGSTSTNPAARTGQSGKNNSQSKKKPRQGRNPASRTSTT